MTEFSRFKVRNYCKRTSIIIIVSATNNILSWLTDFFQNFQISIFVIYLNIISFFKQTSVNFSNVRNKSNTKFGNIQNFFLNTPNISQMLGNFDVVKSRPQSSRHIQKFNSASNFDPLFAFCNTRLVSSYCFWFSTKIINKRTLSTVWNTNNHCSECGCHVFGLKLGNFWRKHIFNRTFNFFATSTSSTIESNTSGVFFFEKFNPLVNFCHIRHVAFVKDINNRFSVNQLFKFRIYTRKRRTTIKHINDCVNKFNFFFHESHGLGHMSRKPLDS